MAIEQNPISVEQVLKLAELSRLEMSEAEAKALQPKLASILSMVQRLDSFNIAEVEPMSHVHGGDNVFRQDLVVPGIDIELFLSNAPERSARYFRAPIVID